MVDLTADKGLSLSGLDLFSGVPAAILALIERECTWHRFRPYETVIDSHSQRPRGVFFLLEGVVEVLRPGSEHLAAITKLTAPECFGELGAITGKSGSATVRTRTACIVAEISSERFVSLLNACPATSLHLLRRTVSLVKELGEDSILFQSVDRALDLAHRNAVLRSPVRQVLSASDATR